MRNVFNISAKKMVRNHPCEFLARQWVFSLLLDINLTAKAKDLYLDNIFSGIGLEHLNETYEGMSKNELRNELSMHRESLNNMMTKEIGATVKINIAGMSRMLGLNSVEEELFLFLVVLNSSFGVQNRSF